MDFSELPGLPKLFLDFIAQVQGVQAFLPCRPMLQSLLSHAAETRQGLASREKLYKTLLDQAATFHSGAAALRNIHKLEDATAVAVVTGGSAALFGGALRTMFKCLTTIKLAAELEEKGVHAIPVFSLRSDREATEEDLSVCLVDRQGNLRRVGLQLQNPSLGPIGNQPVSSEMENVLIRAQELCAEAGQGSEFISLLKQTCSLDATLATALGRLLALLFDPWGLVVLDAGDPKLAEAENKFEREFTTDRVQTALRDQEARLRDAGYGVEGFLSGTRGLLLRGALLPTVAYVAEPPEFVCFALVRPIYQILGVRPPTVVPRVSATLIDGRSHKLLKKYELELNDLYKGAGALSRRLQGEQLFPENAERFNSLAQEVERRLSKLARAQPAEDKGFEETIESSKTKMLYQIHRLREKFLASTEQRRETMRRHIERLCNILAPDGHPQEQRMGMLYFLLRYQPNFVHMLYDRADIWKLEHQTILLD